MNASRLADEPELTSRQCRTPRIRGELALEALGVPPVGEPEVERRVDEEVELLLVEDAAAVGHAASRRARTRAGVAPGGAVVLGHQRADLRRAARRCSAALTSRPRRDAQATARRGGRRGVGGDVLRQQRRERVRGRRRRSSPGTSATAARHRLAARPTRAASRARARPCRRRARAGRPRGAAPRPRRRPPLARAPRAARTARRPRGPSRWHRRSGPKFQAPARRTRRVGRPVRRRAAPQRRAEPQVAGERLEHVLPGPHGAGVAHLDGPAGASARTQSGTMRSSPQSPPPITLPARAVATPRCIAARRRSSAGRPR